MEREIAEYMLEDYSFEEILEDNDLTFEEVLERLIELGLIDVTEYENGR